MTATAVKSTEEFTITLDGIEYPVIVEGGRRPPWTIIVNGRSFTVERKEDGPVLVDGIAYDVMVDDATVTVGDTSHRMEVSGLSLGRPVAAVPSGSVRPAEARAGAGAILAIMPGQIARVMVEAGQEIKEGEAVCVLEAMKMENELRAERDGVVKVVHVQPGEDVEKGQVLVELD
ncbi:MAG: acetyl-CoA carboxylase biotin carboxyl carrier protein subunit [Anaerolineae bacterium]|nr:acetyl-CoA carboxylase biotin carboxyl carrier protein subunit [Anaerolineae bacterium]